MSSRPSSARIDCSPICLEPPVSADDARGLSGVSEPVEDRAEHDCRRLGHAALLRQRFAFAAGGVGLGGSSAGSS
jgi:hypothetical protein